MTKRDVATWFCRAIGLVNLVHFLFASLSNLGLWMVVHSFGTLVTSLPALLIYGFVFLFAQGIGTELASEGEHGPIITSRADLAPLLLRCVGLMLLLSAVISFSFFALQFGFSRFSHPAATMPAIITTQWKAEAFLSVVQSVIGFALAFGPRLRAALTAK